MREWYHFFSCLFISSASAASIGERKSNAVFIASCLKGCLWASMYTVRFFSFFGGYSCFCMLRWFWLCCSWENWVWVIVISSPPPSLLPTFVLSPSFPSLRSPFPSPSSSSPLSPFSFSAPIHFLLLQPIPFPFFPCLLSYLPSFPFLIEWGGGKKGKRGDGGGKERGGERTTTRKRERSEREGKNGRGKEARKEEEEIRGRSRAR